MKLKILIVVVLALALAAMMFAVPSAQSTDEASAQPVPEKSASSAPWQDRVGFPRDYRKSFKVLSVKVRDEAPRVLTRYGNDLAASVERPAQLPYPEGSILVMEFADALEDANHEPLLDERGQVRKGKVEHIDVMRRGKGFGEAYGPNRAGEWEFAGYRPDGRYTTAPLDSGPCAACHAKDAAASDFVFFMKSRGEQQRASISLLNSLR